MFVADPDGLIVLDRDPLAVLPSRNADERRIRKQVGPLLGQLRLHFANLKSKANTGSLQLECYSDRGVVHVHVHGRVRGRL